MAVERSTYYITCAVLLAFSVAYVYAHWLGSRRNRFMMSTFTLCVYITLLLFICIIYMLRYLIPRQKHTWEAKQTRRQTTHAHRKKLTIISGVAKCGLIIFLIGAIVFDCVSMLGLFTCMDVFLSDHCYQKERMMAAISLIIKMIFMGVQATFLLSENEMYIKHGRSNTCRNVYIVNSIANFTFVIFCALYELKPANRAIHLFCVSPSKPVNATTAQESDFRHHYDCINDRTSIDIAVKNMIKYLYPFHSEFCIMATTLNLILWKLCSGGMLKSDNNTTRKSHRRRGRRSLRFHSSSSVTSPIIREAPPGGDETTSSEERRLLEDEEIDSDLETSLTFDRVPDGVISSRNNQADSPDTAQSTASRQDQVGGSEGYGSMDGGHTAENPQGPDSASDSQEAGDIFLCCRDQYRGCLEPRPRRIYGPDNGCGLIAFIGFGLLCVDTVMSLMLQSGSLRKRLFTPLYVLDTVNMVLMLIMAVFLAEICRRKLQTGPSAKKTLSVGSVVLIISAFIIFSFRVLEGFASVELLLWPPNSTNMDKHFISENEFILKTQNILDIFDAAIYIAQTAIQTNLVLRIHWIMKRNWFDDVISSSIAMQCTTFLVAANFCQWLVGTVVELRYPEVNFSQELYYSLLTWKGVVYMFYPFVIYYRFHCTMSLAEYMLWRKEIKNAGRQGTRREDFVSTIGTFAYY